MNRKEHTRLITALVVLAAGNFLLFFTIWILNKYDKIYIDQLIFQMKSSSEGVHKELTSSALVRVGLFGVLLTVFEVFLYQFLSGNLRQFYKKNQQYIAYSKTNVCQFFAKKTMLFAIGVLLFSSVLFITQFHVFAYAEVATSESDFIEEYYVSPDTVKIHFPEEKRNLIYIFLESMENTFSDPSAGYPIMDNYIPELTVLAEKNINFSHQEDLGGAYSYSGTTWTAAAMVTQTCGVPVKMAMRADEDSYGADEDFLPGIISIGEVLQEQGYHQALLVGSDAAFHGREPYFEKHGNYEIIDIDALKEQDRMAEDYQVWWGFEDQRLFKYAKEELMRLAEMEEPFNLTMLTVDTHFPDGYRCNRCKNTYKEQYANVLACSSEQVYDFIKWISNQSFYPNTTIVISGDHLTMDADFMDSIDANYERTVYNCIINSAIEPVKEKNRQFATFDMFPTTLAAMGVEMEGNRLGLGTNLFSEEETLTEKFGFDMLEIELQKDSDFYKKNFLEMEE